MKTLNIKEEAGNNKEMNRGKRTLMEKTSSSPGNKNFNTKKLQSMLINVRKDAVITSQIQDVVVIEQKSFLEQ